MQSMMRCAFLLPMLAAGALLPLASAGEVSGSAIPVRESLPLLQSWRKARVGGKYEMLLRQIKVPQDVEKYADFRDVGPRDVKEYAGFTDLPPGRWVYVFPYWYIWRDLTAGPKPKRAYGPEQATGPPDTPQAGDLGSAWASLTPDGQKEWLMLEYAEPVVPRALLIYETYNPGAVYRVTAFKPDGEEVEVWSGKDPTPAGSGIGISEIAFKVRFKCNRVRIYLDSPAFPGWNEIDAVGLRDSSGKTQWATGAEASSTYASQAVGAGIVFVRGGAGLALPAQVPIPVFAPQAVADDKDERIKKLEKEVKELREAVKKLQDKAEKK
jgi:hypothetical protein